jgi:pSer/pThr/pTyr-binding forkhead associated (FHA) protein
MNKLQLTQINPIYPAVESIVIDEGAFVIGRSSSCDYQLAAPTVSRMHCRFTREDDHWFVQDLESRNGTYLNEHRLTVTESLVDGDELRIAFTTFRVSIGVPKQRKSPSSIQHG